MKLPHRYIWPEYPAGCSAGGWHHSLHPAHSTDAPNQHHPGHPGRWNRVRPERWWNPRPRDHQRARTIHRQGSLFLTLYLYSSSTQHYMEFSNTLSVWGKMVTGYFPLLFSQVEADDVNSVLMRAEQDCGVQMQVLYFSCLSMSYHIYQQLT